MLLLLSSQSKLCGENFNMWLAAQSVDSQMLQPVLSLGWVL